MYAIKAQYSYYANTFYAPETGFIRKENGKVMKFTTREEALEFLKDKYGPMILCKGKNTYCRSGRYVLNHGEYSEPKYTIVQYNPNYKNPKYR